MAQQGGIRHKGQSTPGAGALGTPATTAPSRAAQRAGRPRDQGTRRSARRTRPGLTGAQSVPHPFPCTPLSATGLPKTVSGIVGARCPCQRLLETRCPRRCPPQPGASGPPTSGSAEGAQRPEDARARLAWLSLTCPPWPHLCAGVPAPAAAIPPARSLPAALGGRGLRALMVSRARPAPPAVGGARPPWLRPRTAPGGRRTSPGRAPGPRSRTRQPGGGQRPAAGAKFRSIPGPPTRGSGDTSRAQESQD